ncbi:unnamed protein product, partial [Mesorhabditis spiculigera]
MPDLALYTWNAWLVEMVLNRYVNASCNQARVQSLVEKVREAFVEVFDENTWIEPSTRDWLKKKLTRIGARIGYNDNALDLKLANELAEMLVIPDEMSPIEQVMIIGRASWMDSKMDIGDRIDDVTMVNAYNLDGDHIAIPMALIRLPFFASDAPLEVHYGGVGFVIGHEFTHTYDGWHERGLPRGDPGNDTDEFYEKQQCLIDEFGNVEHHSEFYNVTVVGDGDTQKRETIADNNGVRTAFRAYRKERLRLFGNNPPKWPGLQKYTNDQMFFIAVAQGWCGRVPDVKSEDDHWQAGPHPPGRIRLNENMKNFEHFGPAFKCPLNSPMNPEHKCRVWRRIKKH